MLDRTSSVLLGFIQAIRQAEGDAAREAEAHLCVDWLGERTEATTADVLELYAIPPEWKRIKQGVPEMPAEVREALLRTEPGLDRGPSMRPVEWKYLGVVAVPENGMQVSCLCDEPLMANWHAQIPEVVARRYETIQATIRRYRLANGTEFRFFFGRCPGCRRVFWAVPEPQHVIVSPAEDDSLRPLLAKWCEAAMRDAELAVKVRAWAIVSQWNRDHDVWFVGPRKEFGDLFGNDRLPVPFGEDQAAARRGLKRRVLRLFPEERIERRCEVSMLAFGNILSKALRESWVRDLFKSNGFNFEWDYRQGVPIVCQDDKLNCRWIFTQTFTSVHLLPPEPNDNHFPREGGYVGEAQRMRDHVLSSLSIPASVLRGEDHCRPVPMDPRYLIPPGRYNRSDDRW